MTDRDDKVIEPGDEELSPEQREAAEFIENLTDEQLEALRRHYYDQLVQAASVAAATLGPTVVSDCHFAVSFEMRASHLGSETAAEEFRQKLAWLDEHPEYRVAKNQ